MGSQCFVISFYSTINNIELCIKCSSQATENDVTAQQAILLDICMGRVSYIEFNGWLLSSYTNYKNLGFYAFFFAVPCRRQSIAIYRQALNTIFNLSSARYLSVHVLIHFRMDIREMLRFFSSAEKKAHKASDRNQQIYYLIVFNSNKNSC